MQHANTECIIENSLERQFEYIALNNMSIRQISRERKCRFDAVAEVNTHNVFRSPFGRQFCMPRSILYSLVHFLHDRKPSMISLSSYLAAYASNISPPQVGQASKSSKRSFTVQGNALRHLRFFVNFRRKSFLLPGEGSDSHQ